MTRRELIQFMDELVELASEENKEEKKQPEITDEEKQSKCFECPYPHMEGYCFPCMRDILGLLKKKPIVIEQEEKKDG